MKNNKNNLFFFIDVFKENESFFLKTNIFFKKKDLFLPNKFFVPFSFDDKNTFYLLDKNDVFLSFFFFFNKFFFKNHIKNLKKFLQNEFHYSLIIKKNVISIFILFFYYRNFLFVLFLLKNFSLFKKKKNG